MNFYNSLLYYSKDKNNFAQESKGKLLKKILAKFEGFYKFVYFKIWFVSAPSFKTSFIQGFWLNGISVQEWWKRLKTTIEEIVEVIDRKTKNTMEIWVRDKDRGTEREVKGEKVRKTERERKREKGEKF